MPQKENKKTIRVLQVFATLGIGGAETWLLDLIRHARSKGEEGGPRLECDILLTGEDRGALEDEFLDCGANILRVPFRRGKLSAFMNAFRGILRNGRYDAIHDHQDNIAGLHFLMGAGVLPQVRVAHVHNPLLHLESYSSSALRKATVEVGRYGITRLGTHVLGTSRQVLREYGFYAPRFSRLSVMPLHCGIDTDLFALDHEASRRDVISQLGLPADASIALFVGRLDSSQNQKNPAFALEIAKVAIGQFPGLYLLMAGGGDSVQNRLTATVQEWGMADKIRILGPRRDIPKLMAAADLMLVPSLQEGLGMVIVEAQAAGLPVLVSDMVPRECVVVPEMVNFLPLSDGAEGWAKAAIEKIRQGRPSGAVANEAVLRSAFSIQNSSRRLVRIYSGADAQSV